MRGLALSHFEEHIANEFAQKRAVGESVQHLVGRTVRDECARFVGAAAAAAAANEIVFVVAAASITAGLAMMLLMPMLRLVMLMLLTLMMLIMLVLLHPMPVPSRPRGIAPRKHAAFAGIHKAQRCLADAAVPLMVPMRQRNRGIISSSDRNMWSITRNNIMGRNMVMGGRR